MSRTFSNPNPNFNSGEYIQRKKGVTIYNNTLRNLCTNDDNKQIRGNQRNNGIVVNLKNQNFGLMQSSGDIETRSYEQRRNIAIGRTLLEKDKFIKNANKINNSICTNGEVTGNQIKKTDVNTLSLYEGSLLKISEKKNSPTGDTKSTCSKENYLKNIINNNNNNLSSTFINLKDESNFVNNVFRNSKVLNLKNIPILVHRCDR